MYTTFVPDSEYMGSSRNSGFFGSSAWASALSSVKSVSVADRYYRMNYQWAST